MTTSNTVDTTILHQLLFENGSEESTAKGLSARGFGEEQISQYLKEYKRARNAKRQKTGFTFLVMGGILGLIACILAITNPVPELHAWFLMGFTSMAVLLVFYGLYCIFE